MKKNSGFYIQNFKNQQKKSCKNYVATMMRLLTYSSFHLDNFWDCFHQGIDPLVEFGIKISRNHMPYTQGVLGFALRIN